MMPTAMATENARVLTGERSSTGLGTCCFRHRKKTSAAPPMTKKTHTIGLDRSYGLHSTTEMKPRLKFEAPLPNFSVVAAGMQAMKIRGEEPGVSVMLLGSTGGLEEKARQPKSG